MISRFVVSAPASGCGKTLVSLLLLRLARRRGIRAHSLKIGPDYIDRAFHAAASGGEAANFDAWAMRPELRRRITARLAEEAQMMLAEGMMGLHDGTGSGAGSTAEAARFLGWPLVLVLDVAGQAETAAAVARGLLSGTPPLSAAGAILNRVGGPGHTRIVERALGEIGIPLLGSLPVDERFALPERHLGLVQAGEQPELDGFLDHAAEAAAEHLNLDGLLEKTRGLVTAAEEAGAPPLLPLGRRIAVARDEAFSFTYPHVLEGWRAAGAEIAFFAPLRGESPAPGVDAIFLPGGYPELHAEALAHSPLLPALRAAAARGVVIYGECGGFMVLGRSITDAQGREHPMSGLLPVTTSMVGARLHLGYRRLTCHEASPLGPAGTSYRGHEFHHARLVEPGAAPPLFTSISADGSGGRACGCKLGSVMGSFAHIIDRE